MWVYIWQPVVISDMQWPAPDGFHVPLNTERQAVKDIRTALGGWSSDWTNFWKALKLPFAGSRDYSSAGVNYQGSNGFYWSSSRYTTSNAYNLYFYSNILNPQNAYSRAYGFSVRCFKNSPVVPTSSWTKLYWTSIESWWIFWNSSKWLISLSSNWQTWVTIADKNLWATTVWNSWDTLSEANCWKYYQRWNNYGFPFTWSVTTSSTKVDASAYWPWNYYSSDTFITVSSSPYRWDTTDNRNLWWWVSQWSTTKSVELKNAYIGEVRVPWENTVMYYPFKDDQLDKVWNSFLSVTWTKQSLWYNFAKSWEMLVNNPSTNCCFVSFWIKRNASMWTYNQSPSTYIWRCLYNFSHQSSSHSKRFEFNVTQNTWITSSIQNTITWTRYYIAMWYDWTTVRCYLNSVKVWEQNSNSYYNINMRLWYDIDMDISEYIWENRVRADEEVSAYYNLTKSNYWL